MKSVVVSGPLYSSQKAAPSNILLKLTKPNPKRQKMPTTQPHFRDSPSSWYSSVTAPMEIYWPTICGEGDLGHLKPIAGGAMATMMDRSKCEFEVKMGVGCKSPALLKAHPDILEQQWGTITHLYNVSREILSQVFYLRPPDFVTFIDAEIKKAVSAELGFYIRTGENKYADEAEIVAKMETDVVLHDSIMKVAHNAFVNGSTFGPPNPNDYDEDGLSLKLSAKGNQTHCLEKFHSKVWKPKDYAVEKQPVPFDIQAKPGDPYNPKKGFGIATKETWPQLVELMDEKGYVYNPITFSKGDGNVIPHPNYTYVDANGEEKSVVDPYWTPFKPGNVSYAQFELFVKPFASTGYGTSVTSSKAITLYHTAELTSMKPTTEGLNPSLMNFTDECLKPAADADYAAAMAAEAAYNARKRGAEDGGDVKSQRPEVAAANEETRKRAAEDEKQRVESELTAANEEARKRTADEKQRVESELAAANEEARKRTADEKQRVESELAAVGEVRKRDGEGDGESSGSETKKRRVVSLESELAAMKA